MLKILGRAASINVRKVLWACDELGLACTREDWGAGFRSTREPEFLALNPAGLVPVIVDDGFVLRESNTIVRYLAAKHGRTDLLPTAPEPRAIVEQWMDWQATEFNNAWFYAFMALVRKNPAFTDAGRIADSVTAWNAHIALLDGQLAKTQAHVTGPDFTVADIPIGLAVHRWIAAPIDRPVFPAVAAYYERLCRRPAFVTHGRDGGP
ncbi:MAG: glutathione S-transferase [Rhodospirillaceae bacterium]|nr:glutathione S-transferase [Rhodospirillaceae bacterium]